MYKKQKIHFVGIGGVGMSGIAEVLLNLGYPVSGSDIKSTKVTKRLVRKGAKVFIKHKKENIQDAAVVVVSSAIKKDNPELVFARKKKISIIQRAEMLAELIRSCRYGIAVAGSHGKTTTTSLIANILFQGNVDPTMIIGGKVKNFGANARLGSGEFMVAEADESDGSFLKLLPTIAVITSIDPEHLDHYQSFDEVKKAFLQFVNQLPFYGVAICCTDHPVVAKMISQIDERVISYGLSQKSDVKADIQAKNIHLEKGKTTFDLIVSGKFVDKMILNMWGEHNVQNALAAIAVGLEIGISITKIKKALKNFKGIERRCEVLFDDTDNMIIDDYGHHPEEIKATIKTLKQSFDKRLVTLFQPHRFSRTKHLWSEFMTAFKGTDELILTDIYGAGETQISGVNSKILADAICETTHQKVFYLKQDENIVENVISKLKPGDILLTLGAGDITAISKSIVKSLKKKRK